LVGTYRPEEPTANDDAKFSKAQLALWGDKSVRYSRVRTVVMAIPPSNEIRALLDAPNFAHLATLMSDGSPQSVPIWVGREGDRILLRTGEGSLKAKNTRRDPRVALSVVDFHDPYKEAQVRGRVAEAS